jgi:hypothetical protein
MNDNEQFLTYIYESVNKTTAALYCKVKELHFINIAILALKIKILQNP